MTRYETNPAAPTDGRLFSPVYDRNGPPIIAALTPWLSERSGPVLEIGSGTGQHGAALQLAFPKLDWHPSDPMANHRRSCAAWRQYLRLPPKQVLDIDAATDWGDSVADFGALAAVVSFNVIHIAPIDVIEGIVHGAAKTVGPDGLLIFYGPFKLNGQHISDGNRQFDAQLRAQDPSWGIRDIEAVFECAHGVGFASAKVVEMPANNRLVIFTRQ